MRFPLLLCCVCVSVCVLLFFTSTTVLARNSYVRSHWIVDPQTSAAPSDTLHLLRFALKQRNVDTLKSFVSRVSDPQHVQYGQYMSQDDIAALVAPHHSDIQELRTTLLTAGAKQVNITASRDFMYVLLPVASIGQLFHVFGTNKPLRMHFHTHITSGRKVLRSLHGEAYTMVPELEKYVELVSGLVDFFDYPKERKASRNLAAERIRKKEMKVKKGKKHSLSPFTSTSACSSSAPDFGRLSGSHEDIGITVTVYCQNGIATQTPNALCSDNPPAVSSLVVNLTPRAHDPIQVELGSNGLTCVLTAESTVQCTTPPIDIPAYARLTIQANMVYTDGSSSEVATFGQGWSPAAYVTPNTIFERYGVPIGQRGTNVNNSQAVVAFEEQFIDVKGDLANFIYELGLRPFTPSIDGWNNELQPGGESTLDIQYISAIGAGVPSTFMSLSNPGPNGSGGPAVPPGDGAYILEWAMHVADLAVAPLVTSISYGDTESGYYNKFGSYSYIERMEVELAKMAAMGLTVVAGSGDAGASNVGEQGNDISPTDETCSPLRAFYPSSSPYVTSVSSTFLSPNYLPICQNTLITSLPIVCEQIGEVAVGVAQGLFWTTGGGFSNRTDNPQASWQADQVNLYLNTNQNLPPTSMFNPAGRGYPDVSTIGHNLLMHFNGNITTVDGTSASGPVFGGLISLINDRRLNAGQPPMGLLNPFLYQAHSLIPNTFMDVTVGNNFDGDVQKKCSAYPSTCEYGFETQAGWNPVTGLGTPNWMTLNDYAVTVGDSAFQRTKFD